MNIHSIDKKIHTSTGIKFVIKVISLNMLNVMEREVAEGEVS